MIAKFKETSCKRSVGAVLVLVALAYVTLTDAYSAPPFIFGTPTNLGPTVNSSSSDAVPSISADGLELYFSSNRPNGYGYTDIYVATRATTEDEWSEPVNLGPTVNSSSSDGGPCISADGLSLFFYSWRPGGYGGSDLYVTTRPTIYHSWGTPVNLGPTVNSSADEIVPSISSDGLHLYFSEWEVFRPGGFGGSDMWVTTREVVGGAWSTPVNLGPTVNSSSHDDGPFITVDGLMLFFGSWRPGGYGGGDLYLTTRPTTEDDWVTPVNLGPVVNNSSNGQLPCISADGSTLFFTCDRSGGAGSFDLWQARVRPRRAIADFNRDKIVNFKDFAELSIYLFHDEPWFDIAPAPPPGDGIVDYKDVGVFAENWLTSTRQAYNPNPADGATGVDIAADLNWTPGDGAASHEVYFGSDPCALPLVATQPTGQESYDPGDPNLMLSTTYYWRIDEVNDAGPHTGKWTGVLWSFTTIPGEAQPQYPKDGEIITGTVYPLDPNVIFTQLKFIPGPTTSPDANLHRGYFSEDYSKVYNRDQDANLGPPPYREYGGVYERSYYAGRPDIEPATDSLVRGRKYYWAVDVMDDYGNVFRSDVWEFAVQDLYAFSPSPPNEAILVSPDVLLSWKPGYDGSTSSFVHDVYLGTSWEDVNSARYKIGDQPPEYVSTESDPNYQCGGLAFNTKYYWRVDEVWDRLGPGFPGTYNYGPVWCFTITLSEIGTIREDF